MNNSMFEEIPVIVMTGGPCAGKTTILNSLRAKLSDYGLHPVIIPEIATEFRSNGIYPGSKCLSVKDFQKFLIKYMIWKENYWKKVAQAINAPKKVILCDRGIMDSKAYVKEKEFCEILRELGTDITALRDKRYHGVLHLVTAALGAEEFYTLENNSARTETPEEARKLDKKIIKAWTGCPHLRIIDNSTDFERKKRRALESVCRLIGIPAPLEIEKKYLVESIDVSKIKQHAHIQIVEIEQAYLGAGDGKIQKRIRKRGQNGSWVYYFTQKEMIKPGVRIETERQISDKEYQDLLKERNRTMSVIQKKRCCFVWMNQYFELDCFISPAKYSLLEIELTHEQQEVLLPPFLNIIRDVTDEDFYSNIEIARRGW